MGYCIRNCCKHNWQFVLIRFIFYLCVHLFILYSLKSPTIGKIGVVYYSGAFQSKAGLERLGIPIIFRL